MIITIDTWFVDGNMSFKETVWMIEIHPLKNLNDSHKYSLHILQTDSTKSLKKSLESWNLPIVYLINLSLREKKKRTFCSCIPDWLFLLAYMGLVRGRLHHVFPLAETVRRIAVQWRLKQIYSDSSLTVCSLSLPLFLSHTYTHSHTHTHKDSHKQSNTVSWYVLA